MSQIAVVLWAYSAKEDNELDLDRGDHISVLELCNADWYRGSLNGKTGYFPAKFTRLLDRTESLVSLNEGRQSAVKSLAENEASAAKSVTENESSAPKSVTENESIAARYLNGNEDTDNADDLQSSEIVYIAPELIRREGWTSYKGVKDFGGAPPKKAHSWHMSWTVVTIGYILFYKEERSKHKRTKNEKPPPPEIIVKLDNISLAKNIKSSKGKCFHLTLASAAVWAVHSAENELEDWIQVISASTKQNATPAEYSNGT